MLYALPRLRPGTCLALLLAGLWASACSSASDDPTPEAPADHLALGNPSGATPDTNSPQNYLLLKPEYALSYHRDQGKPNWVSWHLAASWLGNSTRQDDFRADASLPAGWYQVQASSYTGSGFDRGHNCPSADRTATASSNSATFLMTNMMPQAPRNNQQTWATLEDFCRRQVNAGTTELYIICGSYGRGGTGSNGYKTTLDQGRITVPARTWKVIVILPTGTRDATRVTTATRVIAVDMPNNQTLSADWGSYRTSVDAIEAATGYDLLSTVAPSVQAEVEQQVDAGAL
ncbi:DNA/RNA non-specific endonuclease [Hymenobacter seoulensis]